MSDNEWNRDDFNRRQYAVKQGDEKELDRARRIGVKITIDGRTLFDMQMREPGLLAIISRPDDNDGFHVEIVQRNTEPGMGPRYTDFRLPDGSHAPPIEEWMYEVLGL